MFYLLKFPIYMLNTYQFNIISNIILIHIHSIADITIKVNNFLSIMLNYKIKFYKITRTNSSKFIFLINKSNKKQRNQKGSGKSRIGSLKSAVHRGGGVIFGPRPGLVNLKINKKEWLYIYKSFILYNRRTILWFYISKNILDYKIINFYKIFKLYLGVADSKKIMFLIKNKYFLCERALPKLPCSNINLLNFFKYQYIVNLI